jgi:hypothetical protein
MRALNFQNASSMFDRAGSFFLIIQVEPYRRAPAHLNMCRNHPKGAFFTDRICKTSQTAMVHPPNMESHQPEKPQEGINVSIFFKRSRNSHSKGPVTLPWFW